MGMANVRHNPTPQRGQRQSVSSCRLTLRRRIASGAVLSLRHDDPAAGCHFFRSTRLASTLLSVCRAPLTSTESATFSEAQAASLNCVDAFVFTSVEPTRNDRLADVPCKRFTMVCSSACGIMFEGSAWIPDKTGERIIQFATKYRF